MSSFPSFLVGVALGAFMVILFVESNGWNHWYRHRMTGRDDR